MKASVLQEHIKRRPHEAGVGPKMLSPAGLVGALFMATRPMSTADTIQES